MNQIKAAAAAVLVCAAASASIAQEEEDFLLRTAGDLAALCTVDAADERHVAAIHMCHGFLVGVHQFHMAQHADGSEGIYCLPDNDPPTRNEAAQEFAAWATQTLGAAGLPAVEGLVRWAASRFPCD
jgi:hypothetical protein